MTTLLNNRYQIIQVLGSGGFGDTFLAEDTHMPSRRQCVVKQLKPLTNEPQLYQLIQQKFQREAAILESLGEGSEQIPKLYAYFGESGQFYLVQEWIQGRTLSRQVETQGPLSPDVVRELLISLLQVLDYVHSKGIIHRDIKPDNIILPTTNAKPVLIDFGAVKETIATLLVKSQSKNRHSVVLGTPGFMSPEQATGRSLYASDIYSLGMTAIYLLTGKLPQELEIEPKTEQLLWQQYAPYTSSGLAAVLNQAIQYHPRDRYTTAIKMLDALTTLAPVAVRQNPTQATVAIPSLSKKSPRRQPLPVTSPQSPPAIDRSSNQGKRQQTIILGSLLAGSLLGAAVVFFSLARNQFAPTTVTGQPTQPASEPSTKPTPVAESPAPPAPIPAPPVKIAPPEPQPTPAETTDDEATPPSTPSPTPEPEATAPIEPTPEPEAPPANDTASDRPAANILTFPVGTAEDQVKAALGEPARTSRGVWANTRAVLYELEPNQITLGYLYDQDSRRIRQTEIALAQSVEPQAMQRTLQTMLGDRAAINISQGLQQVYQRQTNKYSFSLGELKGVIERNDRDRIYIGVWDADLH